MRIGSLLYRKIVYQDKMFLLPFREALLMASSRSELSALENTESLGMDEYDNLIMRQIAEIVNYAYEHVPFYRALYGRAGFRTGDVSSITDFEHLPCINKEMVKDNFESFCSDELSHIKHKKDYTGGSTDKPLAFYRDGNTICKGRAFFAYYWNHYGYRYGQDRCVVLRGHHIMRDRNDCIYNYDILQNYKRFDSGYISDKSLIPEYKKQMENFKARVMQAYPSSAYNLAKTFECAGVEPPRFDLILLASENNYPEQIAYIQKMYRAKRVMYHYGQSESVSLAFKYQDSDCLGFMQTYGYSELINGTGEAVMHAGDMGQIIGTSYNKAMPLIRYQTGDYAIKSNYQSNDWMRNCPSIERIEGRKHEFLVTKDMRLISLCYIAGAHMPSLSLIGDMQYYQDTPGKVCVLVTGIGGELIPDSSIQAVKKGFVDMFGDNMDVQISPVTSLSRTALNKRIMLVQKLNIDALKK